MPTKEQKKEIAKIIAKLDSYDYFTYNVNDAYYVGKVVGIEFKLPDVIGGGEITFNGTYYTVTFDFVMASASSSNLGTAFHSALVNLAHRLSGLLVSIGAIAS